MGDADTVVISTAIRETNPEFVEARDRGLRVLLRAAALRVGHARPPRRLSQAPTADDRRRCLLSRCAIAGSTRPSPSAACSADSGVGAYDGTGDVFVAGRRRERRIPSCLHAGCVAVVTNVEPASSRSLRNPRGGGSSLRADFARRIQPVAPWSPWRRPGGRRSGPNGQRALM